MKTLVKTACLLLVLSFNTVLSAKNSLERSSAFAHLTEVNAQWLKYAKDAPAIQVSFATDVDRIQYHLVLVERFLSTNKPSGFSADALKKRSGLLDKLKEYAATGVFPVNTYHALRTPYFIDNYGTYCAVGYLISVSGNDVLAKKINREHRFDYIYDIKTAGLTEWAVAYGFTVDELAWIQPGYSPKTKFQPIGIGTNGPIGGMAADNVGKRILFHGAFSELNGSPCMNIGSYSGGQLSCLGGGIEGTINDIAANYKEVIVSGKISHDGNTYPLAIYDGQSCTYVQIPDRQGATGGAIFTVATLIEIVIEDESIPGTAEVWIREDNSWKRKLSVVGKIYDLDMSSGTIAYGGAFKSATVYKQFTGPENYTVNNILFYHSTGQKWSGLDGEVSDTVRVVKSLGFSYIFAGTCSNASGRSEICMTRYLNDVFQHLITAKDLSGTYENDNTIYAIDVYNKTDLIIGGHFSIDPMIGTYARNLIAYNLIHSYMIPLGVCDDIVTGVAGFDNTGFLGGHFKRTAGQDINHLAMIEMPASIKDETRIGISVYPNPAKTNITIDIGDDIKIENVHVTDMMGRTAINSSVSPQGAYSLDVSTLKPGMYVLTVETKGSQRLQKTFSVR